MQIEIDAIDKCIDSIDKRIERDKERIESDEQLSRMLSSYQALMKECADFDKATNDFNRRNLELNELLNKQKDFQRVENGLRCLLDNKTISEEKLIALNEENTNTINSLTKKLNEALDRGRDVTALSDGLETRLENSMSSIYDLTKQLNEALARIREVNTANDELKNQLDVTIVRKHELETINDDLYNQWEKAKERVKFVERLHSNQVNTIHDLTEKNEQLMRENEQFKLNYEMSKNQGLSVNNLNKEIEKANRMVCDEQNKVYNLQKINKILNDNLVELTSANSLLELKNTELNREISHCDGLIDTLKSENNNLNSKLVEIRKLF